MNDLFPCTVHLLANSAQFFRFAGNTSRILTIGAYVVIAFLLTATFGTFAGQFYAWHFQLNLPCKNPSIRREWRALTMDEKRDFIRAFNCLATIPSAWRSNGTIYDEYAYLHGTIGSWGRASCTPFSNRLKIF